MGNHKSYFKFRLKKYCELFYISAEQVGRLEIEQTTDTGGKMTEGDKRISYSTRPGCTATESSINQIIRTLAEQI